MNKVPEQINLMLKPTEINCILAHLGQGKFNDVWELVANIKGQADQAIREFNTPAPSLASA